MAPLLPPRFRMLLLLGLLAVAGTVAPAAAQAGAQVAIFPCPTEASQAWRSTNGMLELVPSTTASATTTTAGNSGTNTTLCLAAGELERDANLLLAACNTSAPEQRFALEGASVLNPPSALVLDVAGYANATGSRVHLWTVTGRANQQWRLTAGGQLVGAMSGKCLGPNPPRVRPCDPSSPQRLLPMCNPALSPSERAADMVGRVGNLTLKAQQLGASAGNNQLAPGFPELNVTGPRYNEALHGAVCACLALPGRGTVCPSSFPHGLLLSASLNRTLWALTGEAIGLEARSIHNAGSRCGPSLWAPDVNLIRDPRWGRAMEVPGEDPAINAEYGSHFIYAMQYGGVATEPVPAPYQRVLSQPKHAIVYNLEGLRNVPNPPYQPRPAFNAVVGPRDLVQYYLHPWRAAIQKGVARGAMCSVNSVNGVPSCANRAVIDKVFRGEFALSGHVVTDGGACQDPNFKRFINRTFGNYSDDLAVLECIAVADAELGTLLINRVVDATRTVGLPVAAVDRALTHIYENQVRAGLWEDVPGLSAISPTDVLDSDAHRALAREGAEQGIVLLQNKGDLLPLNPASTKAALIGPHLNATDIMLSNYNGLNTLVKSNSPLLALQRFQGGRNLGGTVQACDLAADGCATLFPNALEEVTRAAAAADVAVVFVGLFPCGGGAKGGGAARESEGQDRSNITLPGQQAAIVAAALRGNPNTVVVLMNGGQVALPPTVLQAPAIALAFYPGELGGPALVRVLFGLAPVSGRLPYTMYGPAYTAQRAMNDSSLDGGSGTTYRYYEPAPQFAFGTGLSYTQFRVTAEAPGCRLAVTTAQLAAEFDAYYKPNPGAYSPAFAFHVGAENTGTSHASPVSIMAFAMYSSGGQGAGPLSKLVGFERSGPIATGATAQLAVGLLPAPLTTVSATGVQSFIAETVTIELRTGDPSASPTSCQLVVSGPDVVVWRLPEGV